MKILVLNPFAGEMRETERCRQVARPDTQIVFENIADVYPLNYVTYIYYRHLCADAVVAFKALLQEGAKLGRHAGCLGVDLPGDALLELLVCDAFFGRPFLDRQIKAERRSSAKQHNDERVAAAKRRAKLERATVKLMSRGLSAQLAYATIRSRDRKSTRLNSSH